MSPRRRCLPHCQPPPPCSSNEPQGSLGSPCRTPDWWLWNCQGWDQGTSSFVLFLNSWMCGQASELLPELFYFSLSPLSVDLNPQTPALTPAPHSSHSHIFWGPTALPQCDTYFHIPGVRQSSICGIWDGDSTSWVGQVWLNGIPEAGGQRLCSGRGSWLGWPCISPSLGGGGVRGPVGPHLPSPQKPCTAGPGPGPQPVSHRLMPSAGSHPQFRGR